MQCKDVLKQLQLLSHRASFFFFSQDTIRLETEYIQFKTAARNV